MEDIMIRTAELPQFANKTLASATKKIAAIGARIAKNLYDVAYILNDVNEKKAYEEDGFKSAADYAQKVFGFKKTMAYSLLKIGSEYTAENRESNLPHEEGHDFTVTQIEKCLPLKDHDKVVELVNDSTITPDMSCKEIEKTVKAIMTPEKEAEEAEEAVTEEAEEAARTIEDITHEVIEHCDSIVDLFKEALEKSMDRAELSKAVITMCEMINSIK